MDLWTSLVLGIVLGVRHATDSDHVVAVSTIVSRERSVRAALWIGAFWGLGHTLTILIVGGCIILFGWVIPPRLGLSMEMSVALMLIALGTVNLHSAFQHIKSTARSGAPVQRDLQTTPSVARPGIIRSLLIGVVHGLAGSAAVALLVLTTIHDPRWALLYLALFGLGTVVGMVALTAAMSLSMLRLTQRFALGGPALTSVAGLVSVALGVFLVYQLGFVDGLVMGTPSWQPH